MQLFREQNARFHVGYLWSFVATSILSQLLASRNSFALKRAVFDLPAPGLVSETSPGTTPTPDSSVAVLAVTLPRPLALPAPFDPLSRGHWSPSNIARIWLAAQW